MLLAPEAAVFAPLRWNRLQALVERHHRSAHRLQPTLHRLYDLAMMSRRFLARNGPTAARLAGLQLHAAQRVRKLGSAVVLALGGLLALSSPGMDWRIAVLCFVFAVALRFGFLFASFIPRGIAAQLQLRFGMEHGHVIYGLLLDFLLFVQRLSFVALTCATAREANGVLGHAIQMVGAVLVLAGIAATLWAARVIGTEGYHYRDLFTGTRDARLQDDGPYALCHDPMYALGPLAGYGLAMLALSPVALVAAGMNQALLFAFNKLVELPRLWRSNGNFLETERRYDIACSLLGFEAPGPGMARLGASDAAIGSVAHDERHAAF